MKGSPEGRRRFLDRAAFNRWPAVLAEARDYVRALRARNAALRTGGAGRRGELPRPARPRAGARILRRRRDVVAELAPRVETAFARDSGPAAPAGPARLPASRRALDARRDARRRCASGSRDALAARLPRDRERGFTSVGPHMDDLALALGGRAAARSTAARGSSGRSSSPSRSPRSRTSARCSGGRRSCSSTTSRRSWIPGRIASCWTTCAASTAQAFLTTTDARLLEPAAGPETRFFRVAAGACHRADSRVDPEHLVRARPLPRARRSAISHLSSKSLDALRESPRSAPWKPPRPTASPRTAGRTSTAPMPSRCSRGSRRSGSARTCTSATWASAASTTSSTRSSTTRSTRRWRGGRTRSTSPSTPTTASPWSTTAPASRSARTRR